MTFNLLKMPLLTTVWICLLVSKLPASALYDQWVQSVAGKSMSPLAYYVLPQIDRPWAKATVETLLNQEKADPLRHTLMLAMGQSGKEKYLDHLLTAYPRSKIATQEVILTAIFYFLHRTPTLSSVHQEQVETLLVNTFARTSNVTMAPGLIESALLLAGKMNSEKSRTLLLKFYEEEARDLPRSMVFLYQQPGKDRLLGTLALALSLAKLNHGPQFKAFLNAIKSGPQAGIFVARASDEDKSVAEMRPLIFNASVKPELRLLAATHLPAKAAVEVLKNFEMRDGIAQKIHLELLKNARLNGERKSLTDIATALLASADLGLKTEATLIASELKPSPALQASLKEALEREKDLLMQLLLNYAIEEIELL